MKRGNKQESVVNDGNVPRSAVSLRTCNRVEFTTRGFNSGATRTRFWRSNEATATVQKFLYLGNFSPFEGYTTTDCAVHKRTANQPRRQQQQRQQKQNQQQQRQRQRIGLTPAAANTTAMFATTTIVSNSNMLAEQQTAAKATI
ncbi:hypothetical protein ACLKA7_016571 [Drosophila subpalustris]